MNKTQFDRLGEDYYNIKGGHVHLYYTEQKVKLLEKFVKPGYSVLDVGCGVGVHARLLKENTNCNIYGIDYSKEMVRSANKNLGGSFMIKGDATKIPFKDSSFDVVYTVNLLHHLIKHKAIEHAIVEMARVSKKYIIIFEFNSKNPFCKYILFKVCPYDTGDERIPSKKEITQIAYEDGLVVKEVIHKSFMPMFCPKSLMPFFSRGERILERVIPWVSVGMVYIIQKENYL
ncbi:class I SAM-dependent methyltransferase [Candidatus Babeliales bacterium]|nr:class I SAM-dependent methyltransferase [Candidatus Babeliales bacterium]